MAEIFTPSQPLDRLTDMFVRHTIAPSTASFASGESSVNNHHNGGYEEVRSLELRPAIAAQAGRLITRCVADDFNCIVPVPTGAVGWAYAIARNLGNSNTYVLHTKKSHQNKREFSLTSLGEYQVDLLRNRFETPKAVVIDDVSSDGGTNEAMANYLTSIGFEVTLVMSIFYRGIFERLLEEDRKFRRAVLMHRQIPYQIDWASMEESGLLVPLGSTN